MGIFKRQKIEKESNIASTPVDKLPKAEFSRWKFFMLLWNIISIGIYCVYISYLVLQSSSGKFLYNFIIWLLYIYIGIFVLILIVSIFQRHKFKTRLSYYKSSINFFKYFIQIVTFVLAIITIISTFLTTGRANTNELSTALFSLGFTIVMVIVEIAKILVRRNLPTFKRNFLVIREKREEQLILSGKKKRKEVYEYDENRIKYDYDEESKTTIPNSSSNTQINAPHLDTPLKIEIEEDDEEEEENLERFASPVEIVEDDEEEETTNNIFKHSDNNQNEEINEDVKAQTSKVRNLYKSFLNKFKKTK